MKSHGPDRQIESRKASVRAKGEHVFLIVKRDFGSIKTRYRGLAKNLNLVQQLCRYRHSCFDGLKHLPDSVNTVWPDTVVQTCVVHYADVGIMPMMLVGHLRGACSAVARSA